MKASHVTCSVCRRAPVSAEHRPFCSRRCADVDLHRWLSGAYVLPGGDETDEAGERVEDSSEN